MKYNRLKSFKELQELAQKRTFNDYKCSGATKRWAILAEYDITRGRRYKGVYVANVDSVRLDVKNPFTGEKLVARCIKKAAKPSDLTHVHVQLLDLQDDELTAPNNIVSCNIVEVIRREIPSNNKGVPTYSKELAEKERDERIRESNRRVREISEAREKEKKERRDRINNELRRIVTKRKIKYLFHFTRYENLPSILRNGILSVNQLEQYNISFIRNDTGRYDYQQDYISLSVEYPNTYVLKSFMEKSPKAHWVILLLDIDLIYNCECYFCEHNAASKGISNDMNQRSKSSSLEDMFSPEVSVQLHEGEYHFKRRDMTKDLDYLPTSKQAEILIRGKVMPEFIKAIYFMDRDVESRFCRSIVGQSKIRTKINADIFVTDRDRFKGFRER